MKKNKWVELFMVLVLLLAVYILSRQAAMLTANMKSTDENISVTDEQNADEMIARKKEVTIVIDPGHGGDDPGKVGVNQALEKDVNLAIAHKLRELLEKDGVNVVMTRSEDVGLYDENAGSKKSQDMKRRCAMIEETAPVFTVSIHQNSYHEEYVDGAQVFYYTHSEGGKELAECLQQQLIDDIDPSNTRAAKANDTYYLLIHTSVPTVIVECGFLSNRKEADLLIQDVYQDKLAQSICKGVMKYVKQL